MIDADLLPPLADASKRMRQAARKPKAPKGWVTFATWAAKLKWLDRRPLLDTIEPYRRRLFATALDSFDADGRVKFSMILSGRAKKNFKSTDLVLSALFALLANDGADQTCFIVANDADQARDDLQIAKLILKANPIIGDLVTIRKDTIERKDGNGTLQILPKGDVAGAHGKTYRFLGFDEIHAYQDHSIFEALALDPTRRDSQVWVTSYATLQHAPGIPLHDFTETGKAGTDPRMLFSWYAGDYTTDPDFADKTPEERANPSMGSTFDPSYLESQKRRLPAVRFNRLHLNLPGLPEGSAFTLQAVDAAIDRGVLKREPERYVKYHAFVDMSGGSSDDAVLAIAHEDPSEKGKVIVDLIVNQGPVPPFDPNKCPTRWEPILDAYAVRTVHGDAYGGEVFASAFRERGLSYQKIKDTSASDLYESFEPVLNAGAVRLLDIPKLQQEALGLKWSGGKIVHPSGGHDDWINSVCGVVHVIRGKAKTFEPIVASWSESTTGEKWATEGRVTEKIAEARNHAAKATNAPWIRPDERIEPVYAEPMSKGKRAAWGGLMP